MCDALCRRNRHTPNRISECNEDLRSSIPRVPLWFYSLGLFTEVHVVELGLIARWSNVLHKTHHYCSLWH